MALIMISFGTIMIDIDSS